MVCAASSPGGGRQAANGVLRILLHHVMGSYKVSAARRLQQPRRRHDGMPLAAKPIVCLCSPPHFGQHTRLLVARIREL